MIISTLGTGSSSSSIFPFKTVITVENNNIIVIIVSGFHNYSLNEKGIYGIVNMR
jgi:hypothetical protein